MLFSYLEQTKINQLFKVISMLDLWRVAHLLVDFSGQIQTILYKKYTNPAYRHDYFCKQRLEAPSFLANALGLPYAAVKDNVP